MRGDEGCVMWAKGRTRDEQVSNHEAVRIEQGRPHRKTTQISWAQGEPPAVMLWALKSFFAIAFAKLKHLVWRHGKQLSLGLIATITCSLPPYLWPWCCCWVSPPARRSCWRVHTLSPSVDSLLWSHSGDIMHWAQAEYYPTIITIIVRDNNSFIMHHLTLLTSPRIHWRWTTFTESGVYKMISY